MEQTGSKLDNDTLTTEEKEELMDVLLNNKDLFATDISQLVECSSLPPFEIHLRDQKPIKQRSYIQTPEAKAEIRRQVEALKENDLVEPTQSLWNSPILLVKKVNGSHRMCIDFRKVNQVTSPQYQSLAAVAEVVDVLGEKRPRIFFNPRHVLRLSSGENGGRLEEIHGFTTPDGEHLAINRFCFGVCNAQHTLYVPFKGYFNNLSIDIVRSILTTSSSFHRM